MLDTARLASRVEAGILDEDRLFKKIRRMGETVIKLCGAQWLSV